ncbi:MotA/TolQ/ExbB proton channel family protein [Jiella marina]|uniref:MotA/TolQ/ExbB proton channel family protein n=1 Tax=Jiella sp. LLJ827 TaxID=2917712 RepID=UPI0021017B24|nr:MotA/TolQ/ExbB proton channel family protein [Jiella sp. LLJ827]MCQ0990459.1 MotA/TolQ/ExbB proton channel family protein [Jiella sp. LLJ827]
MWDLIDAQLSSSGGPVLVVLAFFSVAGLTLTLFKLIEFFDHGVGRSDEAQELLDRPRPRRDPIAERVEPRSLRARVVVAALTSLDARQPGDREARARAAAEQVAIIGLARLSRHLRLLDAIVQAAPMLGLLGTVIGMIDVFFRMSGADGAIDPALLSGGIFEALVTTAAGLVVALPFFFASVWLEGRLDTEAMAIEALILAAMHGAVQQSTAFAPEHSDTAPAPVPARPG